MHLWLSLSSLFLVMAASLLGLSLLSHLRTWPQRRDLQLLILAAPVVSLALALGGLHHFADLICFLGAPPWDYTLGLALPLGMGLVALGGLGLGVVRLLLMARVIARAAVPAGPVLHARAGGLAERLGVPQPRVLLCACDRPVALTYGLRRPALLLSTWMVERLDQRELEAVLAHEVAHVARRDYLVVWLATVLRDAFCYLPTSWAAYRHLQHDKELACDDLAVGMTQRPLALASALAKVWQHAVDGSRIGMAQALVGAGGALEGRITRLLTAPEPATQKPSRSLTLGVGAAAVAGMLILEAANLALMLASMGCGPAFLLGRLVG